MRRLGTWLADGTINPEVESTIAYVGFGGPRFFLVLSPVQPNPHVIHGPKFDGPLLVHRVGVFKESRAECVTHALGTKRAGPVIKSSGSMRNCAALSWLKVFNRGVQ